MDLHKYYDDFITYITDVEKWVAFGKITLKIVLILIVAKILVVVGNAAVNRLFKEREASANKFDRLRMDPRRSQTMRTLINNVIKYTIYFIAFLNVFTFLGYDPKPLLASAGVLGLAIGFGAQNLVRDVITGFFIIFEDQFAVGDVVTINNITGTVQEIGLRVTRIKIWTGEIHIIPNGSITEVTNLSIANSMAVVDVSVSYKEDINEVVRILEEAAPRWEQEYEEIVKTPTVLGVERFGASDVVIRLIAECQPMQHYPVMRRLRADIKKMFDERGIEIPYPHMVMIPQRGDNNQMAAEEVSKQKASS
ncbi:MULTISPECIES: mechanosensitive ion channel family protein [Aneurinibacillus]|uniref:Mechanosensitive ion channel family protein n=1 Tax=Aneurinibacillus thermoaerophilus TaxID=143495 RepID=A0A1G8DD42_ANETH|nr:MULTISPECIES: mechanosensitive ion channel family protein [Aneurinibacillus]AMA71467.1 mechanosensitive ion channel protein MscS [Aneurinibacillus sp. XH2]MED0675358.1 mechanosensitive ion channel family protein [Aneurinibacillus thermoaerophilus]MED0679131.1 mechanosensitive ion channel family protein [Aneurinibacillus thermoaerophilus]MED0738419.1 mechanosensitive ion channel family protein [Aneurinibacillus thermoaerophilus]MED0757453.1 mechanosensitive ion channel family protein [Aneuri